VESFKGDNYCDDPKHDHSADHAAMQKCYDEMNSDYKSQQLYLCNVTYSRCINGEVYLPHGINGTSNDNSEVQEMTKDEFDELVAKQCLRDLTTCQQTHDDESGMSEETHMHDPSHAYARAVGFDDGDVYVTQASDRPRHPKDIALLNEAESVPYVGYKMNLNCAAYKYDAGDCTPKADSEICTELYACTDAQTGISGTWDCNWNVCLPKEEFKKKIGDGHCDIAFGEAKADLACPRFQYDGDDCLRINVYTTANSSIEALSPGMPTTTTTSAPTTTTTTTGASVGAKEIVDELVEQQKKAAVSAEQEKSAPSAKSAEGKMLAFDSMEMYLLVGVLVAVVGGCTVCVVLRRRCGADAESERLPQFATPPLLPGGVSAPEKEAAARTYQSSWTGATRPVVEAVTGAPSLRGGGDAVLSFDGDEEVMMQMDTRVSLPEERGSAIPGRRVIILQDHHAVEMI